MSIARVLSVDGERFGRPAAGVDGGQLAGLRLPVDGEEIAADAAALRFDDAQRGVGRDGGIHALSRRAPAPARRPAKRGSGWWPRSRDREITIERACDRSCDTAVGTSRSNETHFIRF